MAVDISAVIAAAENRATTMAEEAKRALSGIGTIAAVGLPENPEISLPELALPVLPSAPIISGVSVPSISSKPNAPQVATINPSFDSAPTAPSMSVPTVTAPSKPGALRTFNAVAPNVNLGVALPTAPAAFAGTAPTAPTITLPSKPTRATPNFTGVAPVLTASTPDAVLEMENSYRAASPLMISTLESQLDARLAKINPMYNTQLARIEAKLAEYIDNPNGTGLTPAVENAIYERSRAKVNAETRRVQSDALLTAARRGFTLPDGALSSALQQARQAGADNNAKASVEIAVMQAEMQQKNMQFALSLSADLRKNAVSAALAYHQNLVTINGQAIQYSQAIVAALVETFDIQVKAFTAKLDGYRADASVFETLVRASMAEIEVYKAEISAVSALVDMDTNKVRMYQAQIEAHQSAVTTYGKNIDAIVAVANLERIKLDAFKANVEAYAAESQAKSSEWQAYSAAWNGEESKIKAFLAQAQVYSAQVEGYRAGVMGESARVQAIGASNSAELNAYEAAVRAYGAEAQANASIVAASINAQNSLVNAYQVGSQSAIALAAAASEQYKAKSNVALSLAQMTTTKAVEEVRMMVTASQNNAQLALSAGKVYGDMASSALAGVNTLATATLAAS